MKFIYGISNAFWIVMASFAFLVALVQYPLVTLAIIAGLGLLAYVLLTPMRQQTAENRERVRQAHLAKYGKEPQPWQGTTDHRRKARY